MLMIVYHPRVFKRRRGSSQVIGLGVCVALAMRVLCITKHDRRRGNASIVLAFGLWLNQCFVFLENRCWWGNDKKRQRYRCILHVMVAIKAPDYFVQSTENFVRRLGTFHVNGTFHGRFITFRS